MQVCAFPSLLLLSLYCVPQNSWKNVYQGLLKYCLKEKDHNSDHHFPRSAMLAEALHSVADCLNQFLLRVGVMKAKRAPTPQVSSFTACCTKHLKLVEAGI